MTLATQGPAALSPMWAMFAAMSMVPTRLITPRSASRRERSHFQRKSSSAGKAHPLPNAFDEPGSRMSATQAPC